MDPSRHSSSQFLTALNAIEDWMRHELNARDDDEFGSLLRRLERTHYQFSRHAAELKRLARLRNLIAHNHSQDKPQAVPPDFEFLAQHRKESPQFRMRHPRDADRRPA